MGRGIPLGKVIDCVSKINTGGKYDSKAFKKSVGLNGVGTKAVNALSDYFRIQSIRDGKTKIVEFAKGDVTEEEEIQDSAQRRGTRVSFIPDESIFHNFQFLNEYVEDMIWNYVYLNPGLTIVFNGEKFFSENGLFDLLSNNVNTEQLHYPIIHLRGEDIELALTHATQAIRRNLLFFCKRTAHQPGGNPPGSFA